MVQTWCMPTPPHNNDDVLHAANRWAALERVSAGETTSAIARDGVRSARTRQTRNSVHLISNAEGRVTPEIVQDLLDESS